MLLSGNGGVFPVASVYRAVDGTDTAGPHGTSDMPAWAQRFMASGDLVANTDIFPQQEAQTCPRFQILALIE